MDEALKERTDCRNANVQEWGMWEDEETNNGGDIEATPQTEETAGR
jgi:hypothetical protein